MTLPVTSEDPREPIGSGVEIQRRYLDGILKGLDYWHACKPGVPGIGFIPIDHARGGRGWFLESDRPLSISPSLLCPHCGHHGFIRDGKWVPC